MSLPQGQGHTGELRTELVQVAAACGARALDGLATLCWRCHREETTALLRRLREPTPEARAEMDRIWPQARTEAIAEMRMRLRLDKASGGVQ